MRKHSVTISGHATSFSLEDEFMLELRAIARDRNVPLAKLIAGIDEKRTAGTNLSSALRLTVLDALKARASS